MSLSVNDIINALSEEKESEVGTTSRGMIDKTGKFYHVTGHSFNDDKIYSFSVAQYRENLLFAACKRHDVKLVFSVIQPTHSHDVLMCNSVDDIMKVMAEINHSVAHFIKASNPKHYSISGVKVFHERPAYQKIQNFSHLLFLAKYLYDNGEELRKQGKKPPYCCFDELERGFFKNYPEKLYFLLFGMDISEIINLCKRMTKGEFRDFCDDRYKNIDKEEEKVFFAADCQANCQA